MPDHFVIARDTFFDFGPPFHYLELFFVHPSERGSSVERILLTPSASECTQPGKVESASTSIGKAPSDLLDMMNPCAIPEKELSRELERRKRGLVFSGANVVMQVQCGDQTRLIRSDILDRDIYAATPHTPQHTSATMKLLAQLDRAFGNRVVDKPVFSLPDKSESARQPDEEPESPTLREVSEGKYDALFPGTSIKASQVYRTARGLPAHAEVELLGRLPIRPTVFALPEYPRLALMARAWGTVTFKFEIDSDGIPTHLMIESGPGLLMEAVRVSVNSWRFPKDALGRQIRATIGFGLNCKTDGPQ